jgi:hypothetical protein
MNEKSLERAFFRIFNKYLVVPAFKMGLGKLISNPITGKIMVLKLTSRKTGIVHYTPVNYAKIEESLYCYQGRNLKGKWYLNILANPKVEVLLPDRRLVGKAEEVSDPKEAATAMRQILRNSGFGAFIYGFNPFTATDEELEKKVQGIPIVRIRAS